MVFNVKIQPYSSRRRQKKSEERRRKKLKKENLQKVSHALVVITCVYVCLSFSLSLSLSLSLSMKFSVFFVRWFPEPFFEQVVFALGVLVVTSVSDEIPAVKRHFRLFD